jgi:hypothetical protein
MFIDMSFFEVREGQAEPFESALLAVVARAREAEGCVSSDLVRLSEERRYCWVERWATREAHLAFNEYLFGVLLHSIPNLDELATRLIDREAEGVSVP